MPMMLYIFNSEYEQQMRMVRREDDLPSLALNWYRNRWKTRWLSMGTEHIKTPLSHRCFNATCGAELKASHSNTFSLSSFPSFHFLLRLSHLKLCTVIVLGFAYDCLNFPLCPGDGNVSTGCDQRLQLNCLRHCKYEVCSKTDKASPQLLFTPGLSTDICFGNEHLLKQVLIL